MFMHMYVYHTNHNILSQSLISITFIIRHKYIKELRLFVTWLAGQLTGRVSSPRLDTIPMSVST